MDCAREHLLAGAALALDQHREVRRRRALRDLQHAPEGIARSDDLLELRQLPGPQRLDLLREMPPVQRASDDDLELGPADFDVIFAYPWPDEMMLVDNLFERHASAGSLLVTFHGGDEFRLQRKKKAKLRRQAKR